MSKSYWDAFYREIRKEGLLRWPSQFAAFTLLEMGDSDTVLEFGCGNGRDSRFFALYGKRVLAMDASAESIRINRRNAGDMPGLEYVCTDVTGELPDSARAAPTPKTLYARFFLHTLTDPQIESFLANCAAIMAGEDRLFLEYRTEKDREATKVTDAHFRNFLDPERVARTLRECGLEVSYQRVGTGYAKWKQDDADVARQIVRKAP